MILPIRFLACKRSRYAMSFDILIRFFVAMSTIGQYHLWQHKGRVIIGSAARYVTKLVYLL